MEHFCLCNDCIHAVTCACSLRECLTALSGVQLIEEERRALQHAMQRAAELNAAANRLEASKPKASAPPKTPTPAPAEGATEGAESSAPAAEVQEQETSPSESLRQAATEAQDRVNRLRQIIQGPPKLPVRDCSMLIDDAMCSRHLKTTAMLATLAMPKNSFQDCQLWLCPLHW